MTTITIHNLRNCEYRSEFDYTPHWETKNVDLSQIRGVDVFITYWGSPYIAHPIVSFQFGDDDHVAFSIETRKEVGETYSAVLGFFREYELIYTVADERDVVRLRTNYRTGEEVYLFRTIAGAQWTRELFLQYARSTNQLRDHPKWYNALTRNCTTNIFRKSTPQERRWRTCLGTIGGFSYRGKGMRCSMKAATSRQAACRSRNWKATSAHQCGGTRVEQRRFLPSRAGGPRTGIR